MSRCIQSYQRGAVAREDQDAMAALAQQIHRRLRAGARGAVRLSQHMIEIDGNEAHGRPS